jgi:hypothetical protein
VLGMSAPRNRRKREQRVDSWNDARDEGQKYEPRKAAGKAARFDWLRSVMESDLPPTTRLVAHTLAIHGRADGSRIFPGIRALAAKSGLSPRAVCVHIDVLVRRGRLWRRARHGDTAGASGFEYLLAIPAQPVLTDGAHQTGGKVLKLRQHRESVCTAGAQRVHPDADRVHPGADKC